MEGHANCKNYAIKGCRENIHTHKIECLSTVTDKSNICPKIRRA